MTRMRRPPALAAPSLAWQQMTRMRWDSGRWRVARVALYWQGGTSCQGGRCGRAALCPMPWTCVHPHCQAEEEAEEAAPAAKPSGSKKKGSKKASAMDSLFASLGDEGGEGGTAPEGEAGAAWGMVFTGWLQARGSWRPGAGTGAACTCS
jgi:hypothetical protein